MTSIYTSCTTAWTSEEIKININEEYVWKDFLFTWRGKKDGTLWAHPTSDVSITSNGKEALYKPH